MREKLIEAGASEQAIKYLDSLEELKQAKKEVRHALVELGKKAVVEKIDKMVDVPKAKFSRLVEKISEYKQNVTDKARNVKVAAKEKINNAKDHIIETKDKTVNAVRRGTKTIRNKARTIGEGARLTTGIGILLAEKIVKLPLVGARAGAKLAKQAGRNVKESVQNAHETVKTKVEQVKVKSIKSILETLSSVQQNLDERLSEEKVYAQREENPYSREEVEQGHNESNENELEDNFDVDMEIPTVEESGSTANYVDISTGKPETLVEKGMRILGASIGHTHSSEPSSTGTMNGQEYVSLKRLNVTKDMNGQTIITNDGVYDISTPKDGRAGGNYTERLTLEDGSKTYFSSQLNGNRVYSSRSKDGITFTESAGSATMAGDAKAFEEYAQPSRDEEIVEEYARVTGLPKVQSGSYETSLNSIVRNEDPKNTYPYVVKLEATKEDSAGRRIQSKSVQYVYSSAEQYKSGEQPSMIYIEGLDGRSEETGMFRRLPDGSYIDNSTFREENGEYTYDTMTYDEITELTGKFPAELSKKAELAAKGEFRIPAEVKKVYDEAVKGPQNKENKESSKDSGDER